LLRRYAPPNDMKGEGTRKDRQGEEFSQGQEKLSALASPRVESDEQVLYGGFLN